MADIVALPFFAAVGNYRGIVPDTLDVGYRPDEFRPWAAVTLTPLRATAADVLQTGDVQIRLQNLNPPLTVLLTPITARIETGVLKFGREPAPPGEPLGPPSLEQQAEQQSAEGVPLLANGDPLELGTDKIVYRVDFGPMTMLGHSYTFDGFYFEAPLIDPPQPWHLEVEGATSGTFDVTVTVGATPATAAAVGFDASLAAVLAALEALPNIAPGDVTITGASLAAGLTLTFAGATAGQRVTVSADATNLVGGAGVDTHELPGATVDLTTVDRWTPVVP